MAFRARSRRAGNAHDIDDGEEAVGGVCFSGQSLFIARAVEADGVVECFQSQFFLAFEVVVEAAFLEAGGFHEVGERNAVEALLVKEARRPHQDLFARLVALPHEFRPIGLNQGTTRRMRAAVSVKIDTSKSAMI